METIIPNQRFKHGTETYEEGESYEVSAGDAEYFKDAGWVGEKPETGKELTLDIQDQYLGQFAEVN